MQETTEIQKVEVKTVTPFLETVNLVLAKELNTNVDAVVGNINRAIERGVKTDDTLRVGNSVVEEARKTVKAIREIRLQYTRPLDEAKKFIMNTQEEPLCCKVSEPLGVLDAMVMERDAEIKAAKAEAKREAEEKQRAIDEAARKREEHNRNISLGKGGTGDVKPVVPEKIIAPVEQIGMRSTVRTRTIPDKDAIQKAIDNGVREIPGVKIFQVWIFEVEESKKVPREYRKTTRG